MANERVFINGIDENNVDKLWDIASMIDPEGAKEFDPEDPMTKAGLAIVAAVLSQEQSVMAVMDDTGHYGEAKITPLGSGKPTECHAAVEIRSNTPEYLEDLKSLMENMPSAIGQVFITTEYTV